MEELCEKVVEVRMSGRVMAVVLEMCWGGSLGMLFCFTNWMKFGRKTSFLR